MSTLKFAEVHNLVAILSNTTECEGFEQIVNFLNTNPIKYALTVNPTVYTSCIEQFWVTVKAKTINEERQLQALVDGKKILITESTIKRDLQLKDAEGVDCLPNAIIFEQLTLMGCQDTMGYTIAQTRSERVSKISNDPLLAGVNIPRSGDDSLKLTKLIELCTKLQQRVLDLETTKTTQALEINSLKRRVKKLKRRKRSRIHGLKRLYKRRIADINANEDITLVSTYDEQMVDAGQDLGGEEYAKPKAKAKGILFHEPEESTTTAVIPKSKSQDKGKAKMIEEPMKLKKKDQIHLDEEVTLKLQAKLQAKFEKEQRLAKEQQDLNDEEKAKLFMQLLKKKREFFVAKRAEEKRNKPPTQAQKRKIIRKFKRAETELEQESVKKQKVEDDKESEELKHCLEIIPDNGDDVTIDATHLSSKSPTIVDYKIYKEGKKIYFQIFKADDLRAFPTHGEFFRSLIKLRVAFHAINARRLPLALLVYTLVRPPMTTLVVNNSVFKGFFEKQKLTGPNFINWYRQLRIVLSVEDKLNYLEHPFPAAPVPSQAGHQVAPEAHAAWVKGSKKIARLMLMTMDSKNPKKSGEPWSIRTRHAPDHMCLYIHAKDHELGDLDEPANNKAALLDPEFDNWLNAINVEMQSMKDNKVWDLVDLPPNNKTIGSKWLFKKKTDMDGAVHTYKAHLMAKGYTQTPRIDYEETFSPVADIRAIRILIAITVSFAMKDLSEVAYTLGIKIYRDRSRQLIGAVDWKSANQIIFATSSAEAEFIAAFNAFKEAVWVRKFISRLGVVPIIEEPISMYCDNTRAITIANELGITKGSRHFHAKVHYLRKVIDYGDVKLEKVHTDDNLVDPFTKALAFPKHSEHTKNIGMLPASNLM
nr:zinc finger, CCHC-type [Tanacetum cinerariifolium]